jgi:hypothetical protein
MGKFTNRHNLPDAFVDAVRHDPYTGGGDISATALIDSPQKRYLAFKHKDEVTEDVSDRVWALFGSAVHHILERSQTKARIEERLYAEMEGWQVSGQFDRLIVEDKLLQDWKVTTAYKAMGEKADWERQQNILRWLCAENGIEVDRLEIVCIIRDWQRQRAKDDPNYPVTPVHVISLPVWDLGITEEYIRDRVLKHQAAREGNPEPCTDEERWYTGDSFAIKKPGGKRALKVFNSKADAEEHLATLEGYEIEHRPGVYTRCENFCEAAPFCAQWQDYLKAKGDK